MIDTILLDAAAALGLLHLGMPVLVRSMYRFSVRCEGIRLELEYLPARARDIVTCRIPELQALGFELIGCTDFGKLAMETQTLAATFRNLQTREIANVWISLFADSISSYLEFSTRTSERSSLETNSNSVLPLAPDNPNIRVFRFPEASEARELYRIHRQIAAKYTGGAWLGPLQLGSELEYVERTIGNYGPRLCRAGFLEVSGDGETYRLTWRGAFHVAWNGLWPSSAIRRWVARYEMRNELKSLPIGGVTSLQKA